MNRKNDPIELFMQIAMIASAVCFVALSLGAIIQNTKRTDKPYNAAREAHMRCLEEFRTASELAGCNSMYQAQKEIR